MRPAWDLSTVPVCIATENMLWFRITSSPDAFGRLSLGHSEFWQDSVALLPDPRRH